MPSLKPPTSVEKVSGHMATEAVLTYVGALSGSPLAALLPILAKSLASDRQKKHIKVALADIDATLKEHTDILRNLTDAQYKLVNEAILALLQTTSTEKIEYLRRAVHNSLAVSGVLPQEAVVLSRIIRDISAEEADFLVKNFHYDRIQVAEGSPEHQQKVLVVAPSSPEVLVVTGLVSLGLLTVGESTWGGSGLLQFSPIVARLLVLLREPKLGC